MKKRKLYFFLILFITVFLFNNVNASSIIYELKIDKNRHFYETITYTIENNTNNSYLLNILNNNIFFDTENKFLYKKSIVKNEANSIVVLKYDYNSSLIKHSKLLNNCFKDFHYTEDNYRITYYATNPFYCSDRADDISIRVTTDIKGILDTADEIIGNSYIWNNLGKDFSMDLSLGEYNPDSEVLPPVDDDDDDAIVYTDKFPEDYNGTINEFPYIYVIAGGVVTVIIIGIIVLKKIKKRNNNNNFY